MPTDEEKLKSALRQNDGKQIASRLRTQAAELDRQAEGLRKLAEWLEETLGA